MEHQIRQVVRAGLSRLMGATNELWPGMDRQLPERNLSLYVAREFVDRDYTTLTEWPLNRNEHIDLLAYRSAERAMVLLESKRAWGRSQELSCLWNDMERLEQAAACLDAWTSAPSSPAAWQRIDPGAVFGVVLVSSTDATTFDATKRRNGGMNDVISRLVEKIGDFDHIAHPDEHYPYVLHYAVWRIK
ncbi:hypothetical protein WMF39_48950 [Sorangium sp. So ce1504]|uniref:hypothetical protein n=1 Tax=Sorangium sp. So ce1504 TaxID=3133337 RepID=UPI003F5E133A